MEGSGRRLREDARACLDAAVRAVDPTRLVTEVFEQHPETLPGTDPVHVVAVGKAAAAMARAACEILGARVAGGVVIAPTDTEMRTPGNLRTFRGGHPVPSEGSERGAWAVAQIVNELGVGDFLLCLISGGGSALMTLPPSGVSLRDVCETTDILLRAGVTIDELNCVRKHLDRLKGGRLAQIAAPARVLALMLSDVLGDRPDVIASGPLSPDPTKFSDALAVVDRHRVRDRIPSSALEYLESGTRGAVPESPGPDAPYFADVDVRIVGSNRVAAHAALQEAERRGYRTRLLTTTLSGEASEVGSMLAARGLEIRGARGPITPPACLIASGETTVNVSGAGKGGRNQELVLGAALALQGRGPLLMASMGTDGIDGASHAAGAFADQTTIARAEALGLDAAAALTANDSTPFFEALDDLIVTGPTGTNVMDVQVRADPGVTRRLGHAARRTNPLRRSLMARRYWPRWREGLGTLAPVAVLGTLICCALPMVPSATCGRPTTAAADPSASRRLMFLLPTLGPPRVSCLCVRHSQNREHEFSIDRAGDITPLRRTALRARAADRGLIPQLEF